MAIEAPPETGAVASPRGQSALSRPRRAQQEASATGSGNLLRLLCGVAVVGAAAAAALFWFRGGASEAKTPKLTHTIARQDLNVTVTENGTLESANNTEIRCRVRGANLTIVSIVDNGTEVKPGDVLVRIDTKTIEDNINTQKIAFQNASAALAQSESDVAVARINITEYVEGTYRSELKTKEKDVAIAKAKRESAESVLRYAQAMFSKGYVSELEVKSKQHSLQQAHLELEVKETELDVLNRFTKAKKLQEFQGILKAKEAKLASDVSAVALEKSKIEREEKQLANCVITAQHAGMVIYAENQEWEEKPDIREGATIREDQRLLLMPDLTQMQVKFGIHEARIKDVRSGMPAKVQIQDRVFEGEVQSIASVAKPGGWWNGNMVKYEAIIKFQALPGLKPGMSAKVEVSLSQHKNVETIPVAAVVEQDERYYCWVVTASGMERREVEIGDADDQFLVAKAGVKEGDVVAVNPLAYLEDAQREALRPIRRNHARGATPDKTTVSTEESKPKQPQTAKDESPNAGATRDESAAEKDDQDSKAGQQADPSRKV